MINSTHLINKLSKIKFYNLIYSITYFSKVSALNYGYAPVSKEIEHKYGNNKYQIELYNQVYKKIDRLLTSNQTLCEVSCGFGGGLNYIGDKIKSKVIGLDSSKVALKHCKNKYGIDVIECKAPMLPLKSRSVDTVISVEAAHLYFDPTFCDELYRCLKPGGVIVITDDSKGEYYERISTVKSSLSHSGFEITECENIVHNVLRACELDNKRRLKYIFFTFGALRKRLLNFCGCKGGKKFGDFQEGRHGYYMLRAIKQ